MVDLSKIWNAEPAEVVPKDVDYRASALVRKSDAKSRWAKEIGDAELRDSIAQMLSEFDLSSFNLPLPPTNLPGANPLDVESEQKALISFGFDYLLAILDSEPRRRYNVWSNASGWLERVKSEAAKEAVAKLLDDVEAGRVKIKLDRTRAKRSS